MGKVVLLFDFLHHQSSFFPFSLLSLPFPKQTFMQKSHYLYNDLTLYW